MKRLNVMGLKAQIDADIKKAMLAKNKEELEALRSIKSLILLAETEKGGSGEVTTDAENKLLMKAAKQRKESADIFSQQGRADLAQKELFQLEVISRYLPKQLTDAEVTDALKKIIEEVGAKGPQDMGKVMGIATKKLAGQADGKLISERVKKLLAL
ncbi:GatB/YqeY domain-containing protein [Oscillatoria amoena NRMC-F 0135]|nr:GatB/YqeY domain-containing protein [Oscillatoria amoena NRMC-F 0135]